MKEKSKSNIKRSLTFILILGIFLTLAFTLKAIRIDVNSQTDINFPEVTLANYAEISHATILQDLDNVGGKQVLMFTSNWCGSCNNMKEQIKALAKEFTDVKFYVADIEGHRDIANSYNVAITPALVFIENKIFNTIQEIRPENLENQVREFTLLGL